MQLNSNVFLGLSLWVASVSAIDIWFWTDRGCKGNGVRCSAINPGVCCTGPEGYDFGVSFLGIPLTWHIKCASYINYDCRDLMSATDVRGVSWQCHDTSIYDSAQYTFVNNKRAEDADLEFGQPCEPGTSHRADTVVLGDGTMFDIGALADDQWKEM